MSGTDDLGKRANEMGLSVAHYNTTRFEMRERKPGGKWKYLGVLHSKTEVEAFMRGFAAGRGEG